MTTSPPDAVNWIRFEGSTYIVQAGERALDAMLRRGADVPFSCRKGTCRSCLLQAVSGDPGDAAFADLSAEERGQGFFLPCCATSVHAVDATRPDLTQCRQEAMVADKVALSPTILRLQLEPARQITWHPGQTITLFRSDGLGRSYSIVSAPDDYYLSIDIRIYADGVLSRWVADTLKPGDTVSFSGPSGNFIYDTDLQKTPLVLIGTGSGGGVLAGLAWDARRHGHAADITLYHGARDAADLYLDQNREDLTGQGITLHSAASGPAGQRMTDRAFADHPDLSASAIYLCGRPDMVEGARITAVRQGVALGRLFSDPFDVPGTYQPQDAPKMAAITPDPELWEALGQGALLTDILTDFYKAVYADPRLAPFFHRVTQARAIEKQYSFLRDLLTGARQYFGEKPFNAHHWMVISNELFDYREAMLMGIARRHGLPKRLLWRWAALHEMFRREIVKTIARGVIRGQVEVDLEGFTEELLDVATVCDGCIGEIAAGDTAKMHRRTGELFCLNCEGQAALNGATHD
ncbi:2Fe-2S iron-sulfur cluster-binding protein [Actibacterium sp. 188UL27-1]|uniref:2Fe-2S iron-sulfur cluster-binding protein n=1 Tax=Actibacterium sp. 188UL27-1 TaxID=2786961 RepID=UPI00195E4376|nr:2Fe-2S iron-sulfur cluster binding domain-containing protein [Actibacterium sp. 188UL27-1]